VFMFDCLAAVVAEKKWLEGGPGLFVEFFSRV